MPTCQHHLRLFITILLLLCGMQSADAAILYNDLQPDLVLSSPGQRIGFDADNDKLTDFDFFYDLYLGEPFLHINISFPVRSTNRVVVTGEKNIYGKDLVRPLTAGVMIDGGALFNGSINGNGPLTAQPSSAGGDIFEGLGERYIGFQFDVGGRIHYGWILVEVNEEGDRLTIREFAWEDQPGKGIAAGDRGPVAVESITVMGEGGLTMIDQPGGELELTAEIEPDNATGREVDWSVDDTAIATILPTGEASARLTARKNGQVVVTATATDGSGVKGELTIDIINQQISVSEIRLTGQGGATTIDEPGGMLRIDAEVLPENASQRELLWSVDDTAIAAVTEIEVTAARLTARRNGTVRVTATATDGSGVAGSISVTVTHQPLPVTSIIVRAEGGAAAIDVPGGTLQLQAEVLPEEATDQRVAWSVDNDTIARIDESGLLTASRNGTVIVTAAALDGSGVAGTLAVAVTNQSSSSVSGLRVAEGGLHLEPVPASDHVRVRLAGILPGQHVRLSIYTILGARVRESEIAAGLSEVGVDLSRLPDGFYTLVAEIKERDRVGMVRRSLIIRR